MTEFTTKIFSVKGMHCHSCVDVIDEEVSEIPGVSKSETNLDRFETVVTADDTVSDAQIVQAIASVGYDASPV